MNAKKLQKFLKTIVKTDNHQLSGISCFSVRITPVVCYGVNIGAHSVLSFCFFVCILFVKVCFLVKNRWFLVDLYLVKGILLQWPSLERILISNLIRMIFWMYTFTVIIGVQCYNYLHYWFGSSFCFPSHARGFNALILMCTLNTALYIFNVFYKTMTFHKCKNII